MSQTQRATATEREGRSRRELAKISTARRTCRKARHNVYNLKFRKPNIRQLLSTSHPEARAFLLGSVFAGRRISLRKSSSPLDRFPHEANRFRFEVICGKSIFLLSKRTHSPLAPSSAGRIDFSGFRSPILPQYEYSVPTVRTNVSLGAENLELTVSRGSMPRKRGFPSRAFSGPDLLG